MDKLKMQTANLADEKFKKLLELFPNIATETIDSDGNLVRSIDKDILTQEINYNVVEGRQERYQFTWPGKKKAIALANTPINKTLRLNKEKSIGKDGSQGKIDSKNIYIEGDNLEAMKLLQETYLSKISLIYIDPPYNTGSDLVYFDNYSQSKESFLHNTDIIDSKGNLLVHNPSTTGRFHTNWLNMLYPRLYLARDLLADDGLIFISIDENEFVNLRKICDEIFGEQNYISDFIRKTKSTTNDSKIGINYQHEFLLCYAKNKSKVELFGGERNLERFKNPDNDPNGEWTSYDPSARSGTLKNNYFEIQNPYTGKVDIPPNGRFWAFSKNTVEKHIKSGKISFKESHGENERGFIYKKYKSELKNTRENLNSLEFTDNKYMNQVATKELNELGLSGYFSYPKSVNFIKKIIEHSVNSKEGIVLDFFSGSGTTAQAVMEYNEENNSNLKFILIQLPELLDISNNAIDEGCKSICDVALMRLRKSVRDSGETFNGDIGVRLFYVDSSNMKNTYYSSHDIEQSLLDKLIDNIKPERVSLDLLIQVMLELGIELSTSINMILYDQKEIHTVGDNYLVSYLDTRTLTEDLVIYLARLKPVYVVFNNQSIDSDSLLSNIEQIFNTYSPDTKRMVI